MQFKAILITSALICCLGADVQAQPPPTNDWNLINKNTAQCETISIEAEKVGAPWLKTPEDVRAWFESTGYSIDTRETRLPDGSLIRVQLQIKDPNNGTISYLDFFPSIDMCEKAVQIEESKGELVNPNDMN